MTWTPEQQGQRRQWDVDALDADPRNLRTTDPMDAVVRRRAEREAAAVNGSGPATDTGSVELDADGLPVPGDEVELPPLYPFVPLSSISTDPPPPLLVDRLDPEGHTILYGTGGSGKGALACWWITLLTRIGKTVLVLDYEDHGSEWSRRIASLAPDAHASELIYWYRPRRPLWQEAADVARWSDEAGVSYIVVDSAVMGCLGSDPLAPDSAANYAAGVADLRRPALSLAHVTKSDDGRYPFGSIFWHNLARTTWSLQPDKSGGSILAHRKHNNYATMGRFLMTATWLEGRLLEVWEKGYSASLADRASEVLVGGALSLDDILTALNDTEDEGEPVKRDSLRRVLTKHIPDRFRFASGKYDRA